MEIKNLTYTPIYTNKISKVSTQINKTSCDTVSFRQKTKDKPFTQLSRKVSYRNPDKQYKIISLPQGLQIANNSFLLSERTPTIAMIDIFSDFGNIKIGNKVKAPHGNIVAKYAVNGLEDKVGLLAIDATPPKSGDENKALKEALCDLSELQRNLKNIFALNLSVGQAFGYETLNEKTNLNITPENIEEKREELLAFLQNSQDERLKDIYSMIQSINSLVENGVVVYIASGNTCDNRIELLSLSKAQHIVSASDYDKANKKFMTDSEAGRHTFEKIYDESGELIELTDGKIKLEPDEFETKHHKKSFFSKFIKEEAHTIEGTSFSCPIKMNNDLKLSFK